MSTEEFRSRQIVRLLATEARFFDTPLLVAEKR